MQTSRSRAEQSGNERTARGPAAARRETPSGGTAVPPPLTAAALRAAQRGAGNAAASLMIQRARRRRADEHGHGPGYGHGTAPVQRSSPVHEVLRSPGKPLDDRVRTEMEARFDGADFSGVRLHTGSLARRATAEVDARALTSGRHVVIGPGGGDKLTLAHELGHYLQQQKGPVGGTTDHRGLAVSDPGDRWEVAAEKQARQVMSGPVPVLRATEPGAARPSETAAHPAPRVAPVQRAYTDDEADEEYLGDDESDIAEALEDDETLQQLIQDVRACTCEPTLQQEGRSTQQAVVRFPRDQSEERAEQTLRHICIRLFNCIRYLHDVAQQNTQADAAALDADGDTAMAETSSAPVTRTAKASKGAKGTKSEGKAAPKKKGPARESEVQGMLINGRLVFATNRNRSVTLLMEYLQAQSAGRPQDAPALDLSHLMNREPSERALRTGRPTKEADDVISTNRRARLKIQQVYQGKRASETAEAMMRRGPVVPLEAQPTSPEALARLKELLTSDEYKGVVILLKHSTGPRENPDGTKSMHAEQKLMLALEAADLPKEQRGERIVVRGVKRPCKACWAMLEHYRQRGFPVSFNQDFGSFFQESAATIVEHLPHVAEPPGGQGGGNWMSEQIVTKAKGGTRISAYSGERAPDGAETGSRGGKQTQVTAKQRTKDGKVTHSHAKHGTGGHETLSDTDVIEESDGSLISTLAKLDLSGIRGVASADSESEAARPRLKRPRKVQLKDDPEAIKMLEDAMGPDFKKLLEQRKQAEKGGKSNAALSYPPRLLEAIYTLVNERGISMNSIAGHLGVAPGRLKGTVESRTGHKRQRTDDGNGTATSSAAPKSGKGSTRTLGRPLDDPGRELLRNAMTADFHTWWLATEAGTAAGDTPAFGRAMETVLRTMVDDYNATSIGDYLHIASRTMRRRMEKLKADD
ncbi:hypothetical protein DIZ27_05390 [Streptomyces sp. NWU339]|uniref:eCIS core domain-containing protein n=1 Tax=Streptomyces sp. NWU339 TaxID=2185284 RepID=UPI000D67F49E|nr:DUF4157 domain-containing protein [Streptomyces sp. NWU339]PWI11470.1 hypothetical protein DIZ27_05390 [Streptomyces sp. NWU339]